jgi:hypothetical protein
VDLVEEEVTGEVLEGVVWGEEDHRVSQISLNMMIEMME